MQGRYKRILLILGDSSHRVSLHTSYRRLLTCLLTLVWPCLFLLLVINSHRKTVVINFTKNDVHPYSRFLFYLKNRKAALSLPWLTNITIEGKSLFCILKMRLTFLIRMLLLVFYNTVHTFRGACVNIRRKQFSSLFYRFLFCKPTSGAVCAPFFINTAVRCFSC